MARQVLTYPDIPPVLTQAVADGRYLPLSHEPGVDPHAQYLNTTRGDARYSPVAHNHDAAYVNVSGDTMTNSLIVNMNSSTSRTYYSDWGMWSRDTNQPNDCFVCTPYGLRFGDGATPLDTRIRRVGAAALQVEANAVGVGQGVTPAAWVNTYKAIQLGLGGAVIGPTDAANLFLNANSYQDGSGWKAITAGGGVTLQLGSGGTMTLFTAPSVAAAAAQTFTPRLTVVPAGTTTVNPAAATRGFVVGDVTGSGAPAQARYVSISHDAKSGGGVNAAAVNMELAAPNPGTMGIDFHVPNVAKFGATYMVGSGQIYLGMDIGWGYPALHLGDSILNFGFGRIRQGAATPFIDGQNGGYLMVGAGHNGNYVLSVAPGGGHNTSHLGWGDRGWAMVHAVSGLVQDSSIEMKEDIGLLDPAACAEAVLETDWASFTYKTPVPAPIEPEVTPKWAADVTAAAQANGASSEVKAVAQEYAERVAKEALEKKAGEARYVAGMAEMAPYRQQKGYVLGSPDYKVHDLFGLPTRAHASPQSDLAVVACALQHCLLEIAELKARLA